MLETITRKFRTGCMMLARRRGDAIEFLGSSFIVHRQGYLLTAAHLVGGDRGLVVVPCEPTDEVQPMTSPTGAAMAAPVAARGAERGRDVRRRGPARRRG